MKQILCSLFSLLFICSCRLSYDGEERILFEGKITDENGHPLPNVDVSAHAKKNGSMFFYPSEDDEISYDYTDESGNFKMLFPSPTNEDEIRVFVNYKDEASVYSKSVFYNIQDDNYQNYKIDFGTIALYPVEESVMLNIEVQNNQNNQIFGWNVEGKVAENFYNYSPMNLDSDIYFNYSSHISVAKNQTLILHYYFKQYNSTEILESSVEIEIQNQPVNYEITF